MVSEKQIEAAAESMWRAEAARIRAAGNARSKEVWVDQDPEMREKWVYRARAALTAAEAGAWQPIETAPKDGEGTKAP